MLSVCIDREVRYCLVSVVHLEGPNQQECNLMADSQAIVSKELTEIIFTVLPN